MSIVNDVRLYGRVAKEPSVTNTANGFKFAHVYLVTSERTGKKTPDGKAEYRTDGHNLKIWGRLAEIAESYVHRGDNILVEGAIRYSKYMGKDGAEHSYVEIEVSSLQIISSAKNNADNTVQ